MFLLNKQFYCNTAYTETPVVHPVINKENNKNKLNLRRHSLEGQWFSMPLWTGLGRGRRQWRPETESSSLVLACSHTIFIMSNIKSVEIGWIFFPRFAHRHLQCQQHRTVSCSTFMYCIHILHTKNKNYHLVSFYTK